MKNALFLFFLVLMACTKSRTLDSVKVVGIQPYKGFSKEQSDTLVATVAAFYGVKVVVLPEIDLPKEAFVTIKSPRYRADSLISRQHQKVPATIDYVVGLTDKDISVTKRTADGAIQKPEWKYADFGVMGLSYCPGNSAVVSSFRLKTPNTPLFFSRLKKVTLHELGHSLGLPHCPNVHCIMTSANEKIATIDTEAMALCAGCSATLRSPH